MLNFYNQVLSYQTQEALLGIACKPLNSLNKCGELLAYEDVMGKMLPITHPAESNQTNVASALSG